MNKNNNSFLPDVIEPISNAIQQNIPETAKETDCVLSTVVGFFNNVVLYPVKKANLTFRYKLEAFEDDLKEKIKHIPPEKLQVPPTVIAGPTLEALRYTYDEVKLREMYENLLASAMDTRKVSETHPAFVDAIKQMSSLDASILGMFAQKKQFKCVRIIFSVKNTSKVYGNAMPDFFVEDFCSLGDPFLTSSSLINLKRLGLIDIIEAGLMDTDYESVKNNPYVLEREALFRDKGKYEFEVELSKCSVALNDYGKQFVNICLPNGGQV